MASGTFYSYTGQKRFQAKCSMAIKSSVGCAVLQRLSRRLADYYLSQINYKRPYAHIITVRLSSDYYCQYFAIFEDPDNGHRHQNPAPGRGLQSAHFFIRSTAKSPPDFLSPRDHQQPGTVSVRWECTPSLLCYPPAKSFPSVGRTSH